MEEEKVTVIIPCRNAEETLTRAVWSCEAQTHSNLEILIIDDGSTDGTKALAEKLSAADPRIHVLTNAGSGVSDARNTGLAAMTGDFVTFLDADDALEKELVKTLLDLLKERNADIAGCTFATKEGQKGTNAVSTFQGQEILLQALRTNDTRVWSKLMKKSAVSGKQFLSGLTIGEDMLFFFSLLTKDSTYALIDAPLYLYTVNPNGAMEKPFTASYMDQLTCWKEAEKVLNINLPGALTGEAAARLSSIEVISGTLAASKIAKLPKDEQTGYQKEFETCRDYVRKAMGKEASAYLPKDYKMKSALLLHAPSLYKKLYAQRA